MRPVRSPRDRSTSAGVPPRRMTTGRAGPWLVQTISAPHSSSAFQLVSKMTPKADPSGRTASTQGWLW